MSAITIISSTVPKILAKQYDIINGKVTKKAVASVTEGLAYTESVSDLRNLIMVLHGITEKSNRCIVPGAFIDSPPGDQFHIVAEDMLAKMLNKAKGDPDLAGIHLINGKRIAARLKRSMVPSPFLLLDFDEPPGMPDEWKAMTIAERLELLEPIVPGISRCARVELRGSSARVANGSPGNHSHAWIKVSDPEKISTLKAHISVAMVTEGLSFKYEKHSRIDPGKVVGIEARTVVDLAVMDLGRIVFCSKPALSRNMLAAGYSVAASDIHLVNHKGGDLDISWVEVPDKKALREYEEKTGVAVQFSGTGMGLGCTVVGQLGLDTEIVSQGIAKPLRDWVAGMKPGDKLRCESPFRESVSEAGFIRITDKGDPFVFDIGNGTTYRIAKEEPEPPKMPEIPLGAYDDDPPRGNAAGASADALLVKGSDSMSAEPPTAVVASGWDTSGADGDEWPFQSVDVFSMIRTQPPKREWLVEGRVPMGRGVIVVGLGGSSKTKILYYLAIGAATGRLPWGWEVSKRGSSLLVLTEDTAEDVHDAIYHIAKTMNLTDAERALVAKRVHVYPMAGVDFKLIRIHSGIAIRDRLAKTLVAKAREAGAVFVGIDPALGVSQGNELDQSHQRELGTLIDAIAINTGATTALVAHAPKGINFAEELGSHSSRGGGSITDAVRAEFTMRTMTAKEARSAKITDREERMRHVQLAATKGNSLPPAAFVPVWLRRGEGGTLSGADLDFSATSDELTAKEEKAHALLVAMCQTNVPKLEAWRDECLKAGLISGPTEESVKKAMQRVVSQLTEHALIKKGFSRGYYVPVDDEGDE